MDTLWLLRPCADGGTDYICFRDHRDHVEVLEGYHLPPQMPLIKHRQLLLSADVPRCRHRLSGSRGFGMALRCLKHRLVATSCAFRLATALFDSV